MTLKEHYRTELKRLAWRLHYYVKKEQNHERLVLFEPAIPVDNFTSATDSKMWSHELIQSLPSETGREIMYRLYILEKKEKEVAAELHLSQQAVNRWKNKMLNQLKQKMNNWSN
ncbi:sigma-70 family RNA polymerase sigma factor [Paenibacillus kandeliae]|uniref:sigma-70 family RNA polymerase sigma factor n=1 Tax=Paenibacillus kandeliae TaxID=3231269 RepID=UPI003457AFDB